MGKIFRNCMLIVCSILLLNGCSDNEYYELMDEYSEVYYQIYLEIDCDDLESSYNALRTQESMRKISRLGELLADAGDSKPDGKVFQYESYTAFYEGLNEIVGYDLDWEQLDDLQEVRVLLEVRHLCMEFEER